MAGVQVPLVLLPRYTTYAGVTTSSDPAFFTTVGMDVTPYSSATVSVWRGPLLGGGSPTITVAFEESMDQANWTEITPSTITPSGADMSPDENVETTYKLPFQKRWLRMRISLTGTAPVVSCWAVGFLEERES